MNRRQRIIVSITGIFIVLLALVGLTYGYFLTRITGNNNSSSISLQIANLELIYGNDDGSIIGDGEIIEPGKTFETKTFAVTNNGDATIDNYAVILDNVSTTYANEFTDKNDNLIAAGTPTYFERPKDFEISIECTSSEVGNTCEGYSGTLPLMESTLNDNINYIVNGILLTNSIEEGETQTYSVVLEYVEAGVNQSADMNKKLQGKFNIIDANNTVDITGTVETYSVGDSVVTNSTRRISQINSDGSYKIVGLETSVHSIKVGTVTENEDGTYTEDLTEINKLSIVKGETSSVGETIYNGKTIKQITITDKSRTANVDLNENEIIVDTEIEDLNPFKGGSLAYHILNNGALVEKSELKIVADPYCVLTNGSEEECIEKNNTITIAFGNGNRMYDKTYEEKITMTTVSDGTDISDVGIFTAPDDYGTSYYYRGTVKNNYVNFAGFMWRIVRINGDGSIRLILDGTLDKTCVEYNSDNTCKTYAGSSVEFNFDNDNAYVGYMYGLTGASDEFSCVITNSEGIKSIEAGNYLCDNGEYLESYDVTHMNLNDSSIKKTVDTFYKNYLLNDYNDYIEDTIFCGDKTLTEGQYEYESGFGTRNTTYSASGRLLKSIATPTLKCAENANNNYSRYSVNVETLKNGKKTNGDLTYPIALLSADELVMAGAFNDMYNYEYYLSDAYANGTLSNSWGLLSPTAFNSGYYVYWFNANASWQSLETITRLTRYESTPKFDVRPVINLKSDVIVESGDGTSGSGAYKVKLAS